MYSVDTGHFYSNHEKYLHDMNCKYRRERNYINNKLPEIEKQLRKLDYSDEDIKIFKTLSTDGVRINPDHSVIIDEYIKWNSLIIHKRNKAKESKQRLLNLLANKIKSNECTDGKHHIRALREVDLNDNNIISVFESALTRTIGIQTDELTDALLVLQVYYFDVFKDMAFWGFTYKGEKYKYFTSSAGQIRKKKAVFIKESIWNKIEKTIMCGLTIDKINENGGINVNKYLAYMALTNSATDEWKEFDIDKCIVVEDFETQVHGTYDLLDDIKYTITRTNGDVTITHTDGAGMMLPSVMTKNTMFRAPWIKGLLGVFDFRKFIEDNNCSPTIVDIYNVEHNIITEDIQIIFTKSQFKMYKYYDSWDEYKKCFKEFNCQAGLCNTEEDRIRNAKINYQMLQTLTNITDEEIDLLCSKSVERIMNVCTSEETMKDILGITPYNTNMTPFQKAVKIYPALLNDTYAKDVLRELKNSLLKKYRSGKLDVNGKFTFLLPDFYAACEYWFKGEKTPKGLLQDNEVFCWLFKFYDKVDCLRSPHLYKEHAIRFNVANKVYEERSNKIRDWFTTDAIYTSSYDLISRILQFDVDGDRSLVVADPNFVRIAERNMNGIVPLYYTMKKAEATQLNNKTIYDGLNAAFTHGNIGIYSNNISKIWNSEVFINGTDEEKQSAIDCVKLLCMENNFCIDSAKTLYMPERPDWFSKTVSTFTSKKLPAFFEFAKDKTDEQIDSRNNSFVNKLFNKIPNKPINTKGLKLGDIYYKLLMNNSKIVCAKEVSDLYDSLNKQYRYMINMKDEFIDNLRYIACEIRGRFAELGYGESIITDMLVEYLYNHNKRYKQLLWFCYGKHIVDNLEKNVGTKNTKYIQCIDCGEWVEIEYTNNRTCRCECCQTKNRKKTRMKYWKKNRH